MISFELFIGLVVGILGFIPLYVELFMLIREQRRITFVFEKTKEYTDKPIESDWRIRIQHPDKRIMECRVLYDGKPLPWWESKKDKLVYEKCIGVGEGALFLIPKGEEKDDAEVTVKDESRLLLKTLLKKKFGEIYQAP